MHHLAEFVLCHQQAWFTIDTSNIFLSGFVFGHQLGKCKIDAEALTWLLDFLELCLDTSSTLVEDRARSITFKLRGFFAMFVSLGGECWCKMTKLLVSQLPLSFGSDDMNRCLLKEDFEVRKVPVFRWQILQSIS